MEEFIINGDAYELVSVVIPTYNRAHTIRKSIESVLCQTYEKLEIIVIDDGSTDDTEVIVNELKDNRIKYFRSMCNQGVAKARNRGIEMAKGRYIAFHDSDDIWMKDKLEKQMALMKEHNEYALVYCAFEYMQLEYGGRTPRRNEEEIQGRIFNRLLQGNIISTQTILVKRECINEVGMFCDKLRAYDDWEFVLRVAEQYEIGCVNEVLVQIATSLDGINTPCRNAYALFAAEFYLLEKYWSKISDKKKLKTLLNRMLLNMNCLTEEELKNALLMLNTQEEIWFCVLKEMIGKSEDAIAWRQKYRFLYLFQVKDDIGLILEEILKETGIETFAIYGYGQIGRLLTEKFCEIGKAPAYIIDKRAVDSEYEVISPEMIRPVDAVFFTISDIDKSARTNIVSRIDAKLITLDGLNLRLSRGR